MDAQLPRTISVSEFERLLESDSWTFSTSFEQLGTLDLQTPYFDEKTERDCILETTRVFLAATVTAVLDDVTVTYTNTCEYTKNEAGSLDPDADDDFDRRGFKVKGVLVVDEDGDPFDLNDNHQVFPLRFFEFDFSDLKIVEKEYVDGEASLPGWALFEIPQDFGPTLVFVGDCLAEVSSRDQYRNDSRWSELALYRTSAGTLIAYRAEITLWDGEKNEIYARVCSSVEDARDFFGKHPTAQELFEEAGL